MKEIDMKKITPFLWFDGKAEEAMNSRHESHDADDQD